MMPLEKQVCSIELSKRLKELGVPQESAFYWEKSPYQDGWSLFKNEEEHRMQPNCAAFTVAELGEMLRGRDWSGGIVPSHCWARCHELPEGQRVFEASSEADARAKMLIYLIEQGIIKPQESEAR